MKLATKVTLGLLISAALLAASQEPVRTAAMGCICTIICALSGGC